MIDLDIPADPSLAPRPPQAYRTLQPLPSYSRQATREICPPQGLMLTLSDSHRPTPVMALEITADNVGIPLSNGPFSKTMAFVGQVASCVHAIERLGSHSLRSLCSKTQGMLPRTASWIETARPITDAILCWLCYLERVGEENRPLTPQGMRDKQVHNTCGDPDRQDARITNKLHRCAFCDMRGRHPDGLVCTLNRSAPMC